MKADFSRWSFELPRHRRKHYEGVLDQQGRVWLDADSNEDVLQRLENSQSTNRDIIGPSGSPGEAFKISVCNEDSTDFTIKGGEGSHGRYYVQGVLARLERTTTYFNQPEPPFDPAADPKDKLPFDPNTMEGTLFAVVYLEAWRRLVTYLEDDSIREIALGGPDTTGRIKNVAQVKIALLPGPLECAEARRYMPDNGHARLSTIEAPPQRADVNPCRIAEDTYRGRENRLYRVEVHDPGEMREESAFRTYAFLAKDARSQDKKLQLARELTDVELAAARKYGVEVFDVDGNVVLVKVKEVNGKIVTLGDDANLLHDFRVANDSGIVIRGDTVEVAEVTLSEAAAPGSIQLKLTSELTIGSKESVTNKPRSGMAILRSRTTTLEKVEVVRYVIDEKDPKILHLTSALRNDFAAGAAVAPRFAKVKWSRENAAFGVRVERFSNDNDNGKTTLTLESLGRDRVTQLVLGNWVEIGKTFNELLSELAPRGFLTTIDSPPDLDQLTVVLKEKLPDDFKEGDQLILRRWDGVVDFESHTSPILDLGDGIKVRLGGYDLRAGDYWQFTARAEDGSVERLFDAEPFGIRRYRTPLAIVGWTPEAWAGADFSQEIRELLGLEDLETLTRSEAHSRAIAVDHPGLSDETWAKRIDDQLAQTPSEFKAVFARKHDCRRIFAPLTSLGNQLIYLSGDGQESKHTGELAEKLSVFVPSALAGEGEVKVRFRLVTPNNTDAAPPPAGQLTDPHGVTGTDIDIETVNGIAICIWRLARQGKTATESPPRLQVVEATFGSAPSIRFNAVLGTLTFSYVCGDGQVADPVQFKSTVPLRVAVFDRRQPVDKANVRFTGDGLSSNPVDVSTGSDGIAEIPEGGWTLDGTKPDEIQTIEASLLDEVLHPIRFNACIRPLTFSYMGGDGQIADKNFNSTVALEVAVFDGGTPVDAKVEFKIISGGGTLSDPQPVSTASGIATIAVGHWTLDNSKPGECQIVEARLLDGKGNPILQPIHFNARIDPNLPTDEVIKIGEKIRLVDPELILVNDQVYVPSQLVGGIEIPLDHPLGLVGALNQATFFISVDVPTKQFGVNVHSLAEIYFPVVLGADVTESSPGVILWKPGDDAVKLLRALDDTTNKLLTRLTIQGSFIQDKDGRLIDGDNRVADPTKPTAIQFPSGDGHKGGEFRMWFWLDKRRVTITLPGTLFGPSTVSLMESNSVTITNKPTILPHAKVVVADDASGKFGIKPDAAIADFNDFTLKDTQSIQVTFNNSPAVAAGSYTAKVKIMDASGNELAKTDLSVTIT